MDQAFHKPHGLPNYRQPQKYKFHTIYSFYGEMKLVLVVCTFPLRRQAHKPGGLGYLSGLAPVLLGNECLASLFGLAAFLSLLVLSWNSISLAGSSLVRLLRWGRLERNRAFLRGICNFLSEKNDMLIVRKIRQYRIIK